MSQEATWANGESIIPQARPAQNIEWAWANGESGDIGADEYVAASVSITPTIGSLSASGVAARNDRGVIVPTEVDV